MSQATYDEQKRSGVIWWLWRGFWHIVFTMIGFVVGRLIPAAVYLLIIWGFLFGVFWGALQLMPGCHLANENKTTLCRVAWIGRITTSIPYLKVIYWWSGQDDN